MTNIYTKVIMHSNQWYNIMSSNIAAYGYEEKTVKLQFQFLMGKKGPEVGEQQLTMIHRI